MWQRFTERGRKVVFYAQEEAQRFGEGYVSTEHLLLGLLREDDGTAAGIIERLVVPLQAIRNEVERQLPRGDQKISHDMTLTPRAKRVIDLAYDEARNLNNDWIGTEHLLLGLIRESDGLAGRVLAKFHIDLERAREILIAQQGGRPRAAHSAPAESPVSRRISPHRLATAFSSAFRELASLFALDEVNRQVVQASAASTEAAGPLGPAYLALMILENPSDRLKQAFEALGVSPQAAAGILIGRLMSQASQGEGEVVSVAELLAEAHVVASELGSSPIEDGHLLLAAMRLEAPLVEQTLNELEVTAEGLAGCLHPEND